MTRLYNFIIILLFACIALADIVYLEFEDGDLSDGLTVENSVEGFSGKGYVGRFEKAKVSASVTVEVKETSTYKLSLIYYAPFGEKTNTVLVNGSSVGDFVFPNGETFETMEIGNVLLAEGKNTLTFESSWGWMYVDAFVLDTTPLLNTSGVNVAQNITDTLVNPNATSSTKKLYKFLKDNYGKKILTGFVGKAATVADESKGNELDYIRTTTGKTPAVFNLDFIFDSNDCAWTPSPTVHEQAIDWWKKVDGHGILSAQFHWQLKGSDGNVNFYYFNTTNYNGPTDFDVNKAIIEGTDENKRIIADIDKISRYLKQMQDVGMPVLWRPLHENDGTWFWWGAYGSAPAAKLWNIVYDRMTNYHHLNNLIWVWCGHMDENTPLDKIDIIGLDIYSDDHSSHYLEYFNALQFTNGEKMVVLSENGRIPDINKCVEDNAWWGYFQTWYGDFMLSEEYNSKDLLKSIFNSPFVLNQEDLPKFDEIDMEKECWSLALGYPCCVDSYVYLEDENGKWGYDWIKGTWCGYIDVDSCWSLDIGYKCCTKTCDVITTDEFGSWGAENGEWCGISSSYCSV